MVQGQRVVHGAHNHDIAIGFIGAYQNAVSQTSARLRQYLLWIKNLGWWTLMKLGCQGVKVLWGADNHTHSFSLQSSVNAGGDAETVPRHYTVNYFIKIEM